MPFSITDLAGPSQKVDPVLPLVLSQLDLLGKSVQMFDKAGHNGEYAGINVIAHAGIYRSN